MTRRFLRWLHITVSPWIVVLIAGPALLAEAGYWILYFKIPILPFFVVSAFSIGFSILLFLGIPFYYACQRFDQFYPLTNVSYGGWLGTTPWRRGLPLPKGPWEIAWQDVVVVGFLNLLLIRYLLALPRELRQVIPPFAWWSPSFVFLAAYLLRSFRILFRWEWEGLGFAFLFTLDFLLYLRPPAPVWMVCFLIFYLFIRKALWSILTGVYERGEEMAAFVFPCPPQLFQGVVKGEEPSCGWPFESLFPDTLAGLFRARNRVLFSIFVGFSTLAITEFFVFFLKPQRLSGQPAGIVGLSLIAAAAIYLRLVVYLLAAPAWIAPPFGILGRIRTGRLIIPSYDRVFVAPILMLVVGGAVPLVFWQAGIGAFEPITSSIVEVVVLLIAFFVGPSRKEWTLTASWRLVAPRPRTSKYKFLKGLGG